MRGAGTLAIALATGLALGAAARMATGPETSTPGVEEGTPTPPATLEAATPRPGRASAPRRAGSRGPEPDGPAGASLDASPAAASPAAPETDPAVAALLAALNEPTPPPVRGPGAIEGTVRTPGGAPVEGVRVVATPILPAPDIVAPPFEGDRLEVGAEERALAAEVREAVREERRDAAGAVEARSDETGRFRIEGLAAVCGYRVEGELHGYRVTCALAGGLLEPEWPLGYRDGDRLELEAVALGRLELDIRAPFDLQASPPNVLWSNADEGASGGLSDWERGADLIPGSYTLEAHARHAGRSYFAGPLALDVAAGATSRATLELKAVRGLLIRVALPDDAPGRLYAAYLRLTPGAIVDGDILEAEGEKATPMSVLAGPAVFEAWNLRAGRYLVGVGWMGEPIRAVHLVDLAEGATEVELPAPSPEAEVLRIRILDAADLPIREECELVVAPEAMDVGVEELEPDGLVRRFRVPRDVARSWRSGEVHLFADRGGGWLVPLAAADAPEVTLRPASESRAQLRVEISGAEESLRAALEVNVRRRVRGPDGSSARADVTERAVPPEEPLSLELPEGTYELDLVLETDRLERFTVATAAVELGAAGATVPLRAPPLATLVVEAGFGTYVRLSPGARSKWVGPDEPARFELVPHGDYELEFREPRPDGPDQPRRMRVSVPAQERVRLEAGGAAR